MGMLRLVAPALLAVLAVPAAADQTAAVDEADPIRRVERQEIARILAADNLDTDRLATRDIADTIRAIPRGQAPEDFWTAYQAHVRAWERAAAAEERATATLGAKPAEMELALAELIAAEAEVADTFYEVERIARLRGVAMPIPPAEARQTI